MNARLTVLSVLLLSLTLTWPARADFDAAPQGWYLGLGSSSVNVDLDLGAGADLGEAASRVEGFGQGGRLHAGYRFSEGFAVQLEVVGSEHDTGEANATATFASAQLDAITYLTVDHRVQPYLAGGIGAAAVEFQGGSVDGSQISGGQVDVGAGIDVRVTEHLDFGLNYRFAMQNYLEEEITNPSKAPTEIDGSGQSHIWGMQVRWTF